MSSFVKAMLQNRYYVSGQLLDMPAVCRVYHVRLVWRQRRDDTCFPKYSNHKTLDPLPQPLKALTQWSHWSCEHIWQWRDPTSRSVASSLLSRPPRDLLSAAVLLLPVVNRRRRRRRINPNSTVISKFKKSSEVKDFEIKSEIMTFWPMFLWSITRGNTTQALTVNIFQAQTWALNLSLWTCDLYKRLRVFEAVSH